MTGRTQVCDVEGTLPESKRVGFPKVLSWGPCYFQNILMICQLLQCGSALLASGSDVNEIEHTLSKELETVTQ